MTTKAMGALLVSDVERSVEFYRHLGFVVHDRPAGRDCARVGAYHLEIVLAGPGAGDISDLLDEGQRVLKPGGSFPLVITDFEDRRRAVETSGVAAIRDATGPWGDRAFTVTDPDNVTVLFCEMTVRPDTETIDYYMTGVDAIEQALAGLKAFELDTSRALGKWTIRQIVHHIVDGDIHWLSPMQIALIFPGQLTWTGYLMPDEAAKMLVYGRRPIEEAMAFLRALRSYVAHTVREVPGALDRSVKLGTGGVTFPVRHMLTLLGGHARHHAKQISETRKQSP